MIDPTLSALSWIAVIGGAGKTCTAHLIRRMLEDGAGQRLGLVTTRHSYIDAEVLPAPRWQSWRADLAQRLCQMQESHCTGGIFTMTPAMLHAGFGAEMHWSMAVVTSLNDSAQAEQVFHDLQGRCETLICSVDDADTRRLAQLWQGKRCTYAEKRGEAEVNGRNLRLLRDHIEFEALCDEGIARVRLAVHGGFGLYHSLAALAVGRCWGISLKRMVEILDHAGGVTGRMELHKLVNGVDVLIDSACTPEQLENLLLTAQLLAEGGRVLLVCGAAGDRGREQRASIGEVISRMADRIFLTADDPRTEPVELICEDIRKGMSGRRGMVIPDREKAIVRAVSMAGAGDLVVLAGRGDANTMLIGNQAIAFDERDVLKRLCQRMTAF